MLQKDILKGRSKCKDYFKIECLCLWYFNLNSIFSVNQGSMSDLQRSYDIVLLVNNNRLVLDKAMFFDSSFQSHVYCSLHLTDSASQIN